MNYFGIYRGVVIAKDDVNAMRLRVSVPRLTGTDSVLAWPCASRSDYDAAKPGIGVWVMFEGGDLNYPVWVGLFGEGLPSSAEGGPSIAHAIVQSSPPDPNNPVVDPPTGLLWVDED